MNSDDDKSNLLAQFQQYLEQNSSDTVLANEPPDLHTLLTEMVALKTEVKAEARQFKNTLETLSKALTTLQNDNKKLSDSLFEMQQQQQVSQQNMLLELVDIYDRLKAGGDSLQSYQPVNTLFKSSRKLDVKFIRQFQQGQSMSLKRFEQLLQRQQVSVIESEGKVFDPHFMDAVEVASEPAIENGIVLETLRTGFIYQDKVLRLADVKVNKI